MEHICTMSYTMPLRAKHFLIVILVFLAEIMVATTFAHIRWVRSWLSDYLVVILIYHFIKAIREVRPLPLALTVFLFSCLVEMAQYFHLADLLGFHHPNLLRTLLGTTFSWTDILMYLSGCITSYFVDSFVLFQPKPRLE